MDISKDKIAYVDETGIDSYIYREHGWSKRGVPLTGLVSGRKYKRVGIVAAKMGKDIISPLQYDGTMNSTLFEMWFEHHLLPCLPENTVIVMDNASFHRKSRLYSLAKKAGTTLIFLPPYSPELNLIENYWSWLKRYLKYIILFHSSLDDAIHECFKAR